MQITNIPNAHQLNVTQQDVEKIITETIKQNEENSEKAPSIFHQKKQNEENSEEAPSIFHQDIAEFRKSLGPTPAPELESGKIQITDGSKNISSLPEIPTQPETEIVNQESDSESTIELIASETDNKIITPPTISVIKIDEDLDVFDTPPPMEIDPALEQEKRMENEFPQVENIPEPTIIKSNIAKDYVKAPEVQQREIVKAFTDLTFVCLIK